jgi:ABC-type antimicrobial peptide transport system permease subunit
MVRTQGETRGLVPAIRSTLAELNSSLALTSVMTMDERTASVTARARVVSMLLSIFAGISLFLVAAGLYGTIAFTVAGRTRELGLRASLGADRTSLLTLVLRQGVGVTVIGIVLGLLGAWWTSRFLEGLLFGVEAVDLLTLAGTSGLLFVVALVAAYLPGRRAMNIDPMTALRTE